MKRALKSIALQFPPTRAYLLRRKADYAELVERRREVAELRRLLPSGYPRLDLRPLPPTPYAVPVMFRIETAPGRVLEQDVLYSHDTLVKLLADHGADFRSVLDIGSHWGNVSNIFRFLGKQVTRCEQMEGCEAEYHANYLDVRFPEKFDAIWCSAVLEHQRNVGFFLNKIFDDLKDNGILALSIPMQIDTNLGFGHINLFSPLIVIYHLCCAGFCCRDIKLRVYGDMIGVILRKKYNGIDRTLPMGSLPATDKTEGDVTAQGKTWNIRKMLGAELFDGMAASFPAEVYPINHQMPWPPIDNINWPEALPVSTVVIPS